MPRHTAPLTVKDIDNATAKDGKTIYLFDGGGLYLEVPAKGAKGWRFKYRLDGRPRRISFGNYPAVTLKQARDMREAARRQVAIGVCPSGERKATKAARAVTFEAVAKRWLEHQAKSTSLATQAKDKWIMDFLIGPLGKYPIASITGPMLRAALDKIIAKGEASNRPGGMREAASRAKMKAGQLWRWAIIDDESTETDPTVALRGKFKAPQPRHHAAITDPAKIGQLLKDIDGYTGQAVTRAALRLAPLVFVRSSELRGARWAEFDLDGAMWRIPGERMKMKGRGDHLVPLCQQAVDILRELYQLTGHDALVFPGLRPGRTISENTLNAALRTLGYDSDVMTHHGFRSMAATRLNEARTLPGNRWSVDAIERQLAHIEANKVRAAYISQAEYMDERRHMLEWWGSYLDGLKSGNVVQFKAKVTA
jgi:integrase